MAKKDLSHQTLADSFALLAFDLYHYIILAHIKEFGKPLAVGGHPDNGLGRLSGKLDFITWIKLQNAQRAHLNYLEGLAPAIANVSIWLYVGPYYAHALFCG